MSVRFGCEGPSSHPNGGVRPRTGGVHRSGGPCRSSEVSRCSPPQLRLARNLTTVMLRRIVLRRFRFHLDFKSETSHLGIVSNANTTNAQPTPHDEGCAHPHACRSECVRVKWCTWCPPPPGPIPVCRAVPSRVNLLQVHIEEVGDPPPGVGPRAHGRWSPRARRA